MSMEGGTMTKTQIYKDKLSDAGLSIVWCDDESPHLSRMSDEERSQPHEVLICSVVRPCPTHGVNCLHTEYLASLCGITDPSRDDGLEIEAELADEALSACD